MAADYTSTNRDLQSDSQFRAALEGLFNAGEFPTGADGRVLPGFRKENARYYAGKKAGGGTYDPMKAPSGALRDNGEFYDLDAMHWYSNPAVLGPLAIGALTGAGALGAFGGGAAAAAPSAAAAAPSALSEVGIPTTLGGGGLTGVGVGGSSALLPSTTTAALSGSLPAGGTGASAGGNMGLGSVLGKVLGKADGLSNVLGGAAKNAQSQNVLTDNSNLNWEKLKLAAPGQRAQTALQAALAKNWTPQSISWGGPGSGLRGEIPTYSGGGSDAMAKALKDPALMQALNDAIAGRAPASIGQSQAAAKPSTGDKIMGGGSLISSLLSLFA